MEVSLQWQGTLDVRKLVSLFKIIFRVLSVCNCYECLRFSLCVYRASKYHPELLELLKTSPQNVVPMYFLSLLFNQLFAALSGHDNLGHILFLSYITS